jgi:predicted nucleic acid-binding protein
MTTFVLDASVAVSGLRAKDVHHARSVASLVGVMQGLDTIVVPAIFGVEVAAALSRAGDPHRTVLRATSGFLPRARVVTSGPNNEILAKAHLVGVSAQPP